MTEEIEKSSEPSPLDLKIIRQIEHYFGDYNLIKDKFLQEAIKLDDGWVPLETLLTFNRLKTLTTESAVIVDALKKSKAELMEIHEDGAKVRRSPEKPLPENDQSRQEEVNRRSVYVKGFPRDSKLDDVLEFFKEHGSVAHVVMRYYSKIFKGSVFAVFETLAEAEDFMKKENVKYKPDDAEKLLIETKTAYFARKKEEKGKTKDDRKAKKGAKKEAVEEEVSVSEALKFEKGLVMAFTDVKAGTSMENVKDAFKPYASVAWVDFSRGDTKGSIRFQPGHQAEAVIQKAKDANDGKVLINDGEVSTRILEGDEEAEYWRKRQEFLKEFKDRKPKGGSRGRGGSRGGRGGRRGGGRGGRFQGNRKGSRRGRDDDSDDNDEEMSEEVSAKRAHESNDDVPAAKKPKVESNDEPAIKPKVEAGSCDSSTNNGHVKSEPVAE